MNDDIIRDILRRLDMLETTRPRLRVGEITDLAPLDVALGGSDTAYEDVKAVGPVASGDQVAALVWGADLLVLGAVGREIHFGSVTCTFTASTDSAVATVTHGFDHTPAFVGVSNTVVVGSRAVTAFREAPGASTFRVFARSDASFSGTSSHAWIAIG